jgi:hypothetical protein
MAVLGSTSLTGCNSIPDFIAGGSLMLFQQTTAPTNWTKETTHNNKALRVVTGTATPGGSTAFTTVFASRTPAGSGVCVWWYCWKSHTHHTSDSISHSPAGLVNSSNAAACNPTLCHPEYHRHWWCRWRWRRCSQSPIHCWYCIIFRKRNGLCSSICGYNHLF